MSEPERSMPGAGSDNLETSAPMPDDGLAALTYVAATGDPLPTAVAGVSTELTSQAVTASPTGGLQSLPTAAAQGEVCFAAPVPGQLIDEVLIEPQVRRLVWLPLCLFLLTCATTFLAGVFRWPPAPFPINERVGAYVIANWPNGLKYMLSVIGILLAHEMGHFLMAVRYRIHASYPVFIPFPIGMGTMGAVIAMDGRQADRRQLFDIGIAGPLAGLVVAVPILCWGVLYGTLMPPGASEHMQGQPLLASLLVDWLRPDAVAGEAISPRGNPFYMAGWVGMLITGLNMMPISQLDGGHVIYALFRKRSHYLARAFLMAAIGYMIVSENYTWSLMVVIVTFLGADHPPTADDSIPLGRLRYILGLASLAIPVLCFIPNPL